jgi:hypothetical protein
VYALVKALKEFRTYILHSHVIACVPSSSVKDILTQPDPEGRRGKWIAAMLEYDLEIKPTKLVKGQGLAKLMAQSDCDVVGMNFIVDLSECPQEEKVVQVPQQFIDSPWYADIIYVLENLQAPPGVSKTKARFLKLKAVKFCILDNSLYWKDPERNIVELFAGGRRETGHTRISQRRLRRAPLLEDHRAQDPEGGLLLADNFR